jgi:hypothetical protein
MGSAGTVFGLDVSAEHPLRFLQDACARSTGRRLSISVARETVAAASWPAPADLVCDQRGPGGIVNFSIEAHPQAGYLIWGPTYGSHVLAPDGRSAICMPEACSEEAWQRMLIAQVLPFAAVLQGLEVLHASAVTWHETAIAFVGPSRSGKTSIAVELCRRGAGFLADDVVALERREDELLAHPGTPVAGLDHAEVDRLRSTGNDSLQQPIARSEREQLVPMRSNDRPACLAGLFFLERRPDGPSQPRFEAAPDPQLLLSATFNSVLTDPPRLLRLLEVCALAAQRRVERILCGPEVEVDQLADAVERRLGEPA